MLEAGDSGELIFAPSRLPSSASLAALALNARSPARDFLLSTLCLFAWISAPVSIYYFYIPAVALGVGGQGSNNRISIPLCSSPASFKLKGGGEIADVNTI